MWISTYCIWLNMWVDVWWLIISWLAGWETHWDLLQSEKQTLFSLNFSLCASPHAVSLTRRHWLHPCISTPLLCSFSTLFLLSSSPWTLPRLVSPQMRSPLPSFSLGAKQPLSQASVLQRAHSQHPLSLNSTKYTQDTYCTTQRETDGPLNVIDTLLFRANTHRWTLHP